MKKSIVSVFVLTLLFFLLSCDFEAISELIDKASSKLSDRDKKLKSLTYGQEGQEGHQDGSEEDLKDIENSIKNFADKAKILPKVVHNDLFGSVDSINEVPMIPNQYPLIRRSIKINVKDLVPVTNEEKEAEKAIQNIKDTLQDSEFSGLIKDAQDLKTKYEQMNTDLYSLYSRVQGKLVLLDRNFGKNNRAKIKDLNSLQSLLKKEIFNFEKLMSEIDVAIGGRKSAKALFEKAQETLKQSIIKRLEKASNRYLRDISITLSRDARRYAESSLEQIESSSFKIGETIGLMKNTEKIIKDVRASLVKIDR